MLTGTSDQLQIFDRTAHHSKIGFFVFSPHVISKKQKVDISIAALRYMLDIDEGPGQN